MEKKRILKFKTFLLYSYNNFFYKIDINNKKFFFISLDILKKNFIYSNNLLYYLLFQLYNYEIMYFFKKINQKIFKIFLKKGHKFNFIKVFLNGLISAKYFFFIESYLFKFFFFNIFKLPLNITKKQKGRKTIIIPEVFNPEKLLNTTIRTFYKSILKKKQKNFKNKINTYFFLEYFESIAFDKDYSNFSKEYTNLMFTFLQNRSWMAFQ